MKNKYPGTCSCGRRVARQAGSLRLSDDVFHVVCTSCSSSGRAEGSGSPGACKTATRTSRSRPKAARSVTGSRKSKGKTQKRVWIRHVPTETAYLEPASVPSDHVVVMANPFGPGMLACSETYSHLAGRMQAAQVAGDARLELDLLFAMAEFSFSGHAGVPIR